MKKYDLPKNYGPAGAAQVTVGKRSVGVLMRDSHIKYELPFDAVPEVLQDKAFKTGLLRVSFSEDNTKLLGVSPWEGKLLAKVKDFGGAPGTVPAPKQDKTDGHTTRNGITVSYPRDFLKFGVNIIITGPATMAGMTGYGPFVYFDKKRGGFAPDQDNPSMMALVGKNRDIQKLDAFLQAVGLGDLEMPWSDNLLPALLTLILKKDREFSVTYKEGWPDVYEAVIQAAKPKAAAKKKK